MSDTDATVERPKTNLPALAPSRLPWHPVMEEYGIARTDWKALVEAIFPAAKSLDSIRLALSYCKRRNLDPFKRVVHIVPVWDRKANDYVETIWPGIAELRTTAFRTGQYAGADPATFGPTVTHSWDLTDKGKVTGQVIVEHPEWAQLTLYRMLNGIRMPMPGPRVYWMETYSTRGRSTIPNDRWQRAPFQMAEKTAEAAALRRAFPEELGDTGTDDEVGARTIDGEVTEDVEVTAAPARPASGNEGLKERLRGRKSAPTAAPSAPDVIDADDVPADEDSDAPGGDDEGEAAPRDPMAELLTEIDRMSVDEIDGLGVNAAWQSRLRRTHADPVRIEQAVTARRADLRRGMPG